jgi:hypothetical protein
VCNCKYSGEPAIVLQAIAVNFTVLALILPTKQQEQIMMPLVIIGLANGENHIKTLKQIKI